MRGLAAVCLGLCVLLAVRDARGGEALPPAQTALSPVFTRLSTALALTEWAQPAAVLERMSFTGSTLRLRRGKRLVTHAIVGAGESRAVGGRGGHLLLRDPRRGSFGLYGSVLRKDPDEGRRLKVGFEAEAFLRQATLVGLVGMERARAATSLLGEANRQEHDPADRVLRPFSAFDARAYLNRDLQVSIGYRHQGGAHLAAFGVSRYLRVTADVALIANLDARIGSNFGVVWAGVQLAPARAGSLLRHERTIGATDWLRQDFFGPPFNPI